jgi:ABC-type antimicrobial peptide transport system permease subunit
MPIPFTYSFRSIAVRKGSSAMAVGGIALVVVVLVAMLALAAGIKHAVASSGNADNIIVLRVGADAELQSLVTRDASLVVREMPIVAADDAGKPLFIQESVIILNRKKRVGGDTNVTVRGTPVDSRKLRPEIKLTDGRWFTPGSNEAVIGSSLSRRIEGFSLGQTIVAGKQAWTIVGVFESAGSALESELWVDIEMMQTVFKRGNIFQSLLFRTAGDPTVALNYLKQQIRDDPRLKALMAQAETEYYANQSKLMSTVITALGEILAGIMSIGAIAGAMNTMYAAVSQRKREIGCMLAMGFTPESIWAAFIMESLLLSSIGAALGCAIAMLFNGIQTGTTNLTTFSETAFEFRVTPEILCKAVIVALVMGFIGGLLPAMRAARMKVVDALRRA